MVKYMASSGKILPSYPIKWPALPARMKLNTEYGSQYLDESVAGKHGGFPLILGEGGLSIQSTHVHPCSCNWGEAKELTPIVIPPPI